MIHDASAAHAASYRDELVRHRLLVPMGARGVYGFGADFDRVLQHFDSFITRIARNDGARVIRFPTLLPRATLERSGYLKSFPHLAGFVHAFGGDERAHAEMLRAVAHGGQWSSALDVTDVALTPAACYPLYPMLRGLTCDSWFQMLSERPHDLGVRAGADALAAGRRWPACERFRNAHLVRRLTSSRRLVSPGERTETRRFRGRALQPVRLRGALRTPGHAPLGPRAGECRCCDASLRLRWNRQLRRARHGRRACRSVDLEHRRSRPCASLACGDVVHHSRRRAAWWHVGDGRGVPCGRRWAHSVRRTGERPSLRAGAARVWPVDGRRG